MAGLEGGTSYSSETINSGKYFSGSMMDINWFVFFQKVLIPVFIHKGTYS